MYGPLVIGHRGASAWRPEHTALAYRLAWRSGADSVEPDVVSSRDGMLVCRHDLELSRTTDVADHPELAERRRTLEVEGKTVTGWFVHDLDLAELRTLRARERWPRRRPGSARYDGLVGLLTLEDLLVLRAEESERAGRSLSVHVEVKHAGLLAEAGLPVHEPMVDLLRRHGLTGALSPVTVMSFETEVLRLLRRDVDVDLVRLVEEDERVRRGWLQRTAAYATGIGLPRDQVLPRDVHNLQGAPGPAVAKVRQSGLDLLVWTLRNENRYLPADLRRGRRGRDHGDAAQEVRRFLDLGVDGLLCDDPATAVRVVRERAVETAAGL